MYHDDDDVPVLHDFIRFHYQYPAFPTAGSSLKTSPARARKNCPRYHTPKTTTHRHILDTILLPFVYWKWYLWSTLAPPTNLVNWSKWSERLFERSPSELRRWARLLYWGFSDLFKVKLGLCKRPQRALCSLIAVCPIYCNWMINNHNDKIYTERER